MPLLVIIDSNVFVAALLNSESCRAIVSEWRKGTFEVGISSSLLRELRRVLRRSKFKDRIHPKDAEELIAFVKDTAIFFQPLKLRKPICRDTSDDKLFACALASGASCIVSGDSDVLSVDAPRGLRVLPPRGFLAWLTSL